SAALASAYPKNEDRRLSVAADLTKADAVASAVAAIAGRFGRIDTLCNVAGGFQMGPPVHETSEELWNVMFNMNVRTMLGMARAVVPFMLKAGKGQIVNVGAGSALSGLPNMGAYCASKSAVIRLTE